MGIQPLDEFQIISLCGDMKERFFGVLRFDLHEVLASGPHFTAGCIHGMLPYSLLHLRKVPFASGLEYLRPEFLGLLQSLLRSFLGFLPLLFSLGLLFLLLLLLPSLSCLFFCPEKSVWLPLGKARRSYLTFFTLSLLALPANPGFPLATLRCFLSFAPLAVHPVLVLSLGFSWLLPLAMVFCPKERCSTAAPWGEVEVVSTCNT